MKRVHLYRFLSEENAGTVSIEYGLILTLISIGIITSLNLIGGSVVAFFVSASAGLAR